MEDNGDLNGGVVDKLENQKDADISSENDCSNLEVDKSEQNDETPSTNDGDYTMSDAGHDTDNIESDQELMSDEDSEMEDKVIHFLAEKSVSKTRVKSGIKSACRFKCHNCTSIFRYKSTLNYHLKSECGRKVIKGKTLVEKQPQGKVSCNICSKTLCSRTSLMVHMRIHTGERPFSCEQCGRSFFQKAHLQDHKAKMHTASCVLCRLCNAIFDDKYHLNLHMKSHKQIVTPYDCKLCDESFSSRTSLTNHVSLKHTDDTNWTNKKARVRSPVDPNETECSECGKVYQGARQLRAHIRRAHRASLPCPHCPRLFPSSYDLRVHSRCHTGERPYSCEFCDRTFSRKSILDVHRTLHTGQKDFVCGVCNKAFNRKSKLQVHETEHTNTMVKCQICDKEFKCQSYLTSHMKIHSQDVDVKPQLDKSQKTSKKSAKTKPIPDLKPIGSLRSRIKKEPTSPRSLSPVDASNLDVTDSPVDVKNLSLDPKPTTDKRKLPDVKKSLKDVQNTFVSSTNNSSVNKSLIFSLLSKNRTNLSSTNLTSLLPIDNSVQSSLMLKPEVSLIIKPSLKIENESEDIEMMSDSDEIVPRLEEMAPEPDQILPNHNKTLPNPIKMLSKPKLVLRPTRSLLKSGKLTQLSEPFPTEDSTVEVTNEIDPLEIVKVEVVEDTNVPLDFSVK